MDLVARWTDLAGAETRRLGEALVARYAEPHRHYHTLRHLTAVLDLVDEFADEADDPDIVRLAAWFHDAVYDPQRDDNEERSAVLAERMLADTSLQPERAEEVARLVRMTKTHEPYDRNGQVLCDADLAILAADAETYAAYTRAVREEYAYVPDEYFSAGRAAVLEQLLELPSLFHTPQGRARFEERARANLSAELTSLTSLTSGRTSDGAGPTGADAPAPPDN